MNFVACKEGNLKLVQLLCELGADVNIDVDYDIRNSSFWECIPHFRSPATLACIHGHFDVLVYLVECGGAIVELGMNQSELLISNGANVKIGTEPHTALSFSVKSFDEKLGYEICKILIEPGSVVTNEHIDMAAQSGNVEILNLLLSLRSICECLLEHFHGYIKLRNQSGRILLHRAAVVESNTKLLELLISRGADPAERDNDGYCVFEYAAKKNALRSISYLLDYDHSLANNTALADSKLPIELISPGKLIFRHLPDYEKNVAGFVKLVRATYNKRVVWNSLNRIITQRNYIMEEWNTYHVVEMDEVINTIHDQRSLGLIQNLARELIYNKADEIGDLADTEYVSDWTKKIVRTCCEVLIVFVVRNWVINNKKLPPEIIHLLLHHSEINWWNEKVEKRSMNILR
ncbi:hypothetical protein HK098_000577 [Nowakowskiella sp. JEL0407]|nr:hypothetical protein HK098_000577 [Nowakowskiella sp. JEL0407]